MFFLFSSRRGYFLVIASPPDVSGPGRGLTYTYYSCEDFRDTNEIDPQNEKEHSIIFLPSLKKYYYFTNGNTFKKEDFPWCSRWRPYRILALFPSVLSTKDLNQTFGVSVSYKPLLR